MNVNHRYMSADSIPDPHAPPPPARREEVLTPSGIRIVGRGARELAARLARAPTVTPGRDEDLLFAARLDVRPRLGAGSPLNAVLTSLGADVARQWPDPPPLTREQSLTLPASRFAGLSWDLISEEEAWIGELLWRHPHPVVAGAPCTTHVLLVEQDGPLAMHLRVTADHGLSSVHGPAGAGQARPAFLTELNRTLRLRFDGHDAAPRRLADDAIDGFVRDVLLDEDREYPVALLAPLEDGGYLVPPDELADALLGLTPLWVIERHTGTFRLTDALGDRRLSAYWGALRVYQPGFSCADPPHEHSLLMRDRLVDPVMRAALFGQLARQHAGRRPMPPGVAERRSPPARAVIASPAPQPASGEFAQAAPAAEPIPRAGLAHDPAPTLADPLSRRLEEMAQGMVRLTELTAGLLDELARLRTTNALRAVSTNALERRIGGLQTLLERHLAGSADPAAGGGPISDRAEVQPGPDEGREAMDEPTLPDVLRHAAEAHSDALLILESAERAAQRSPYEDLERVGVTLDAMADIARRRQEGVLGTSLKQAFQELGLDYRGGIAGSTPDRLRQQYRVTGPEGTVYECLEHIALGSSYDPRYCLRIYFTSRAPLEPRFVIGHVGRHFEVLTTT